MTGRLTALAEAEESKQTMVQRTFPNAAGVGDDSPSVSWLGRTTGFLRDAVMPSSAAASVFALSRDRTSPGRDRSWMTWLGRLVPRLLLITAVALLISAIALFAFRATYADKVYPAIAVGDVGVGGLTVQEAVATVEQRAADLEGGTITLTYNGQTWSPTLAEIGAAVDVEASVDAAYELGRDDNAVSRLGFANQLIRSDQRVPLRTTIDRGVLASWIESVNRDIDQPAVDASLVVDGASVSISPDHEGRVVDESATTELILDTLRTLDPVSAELPTSPELPQIYAADLEEARADLAGALDSPLVVRFEGQTWNVPAVDLAQFLTVETTYQDGAPNVALEVEQEPLAAYLRDAFAGQVNRSPVDARVAWSGDQGGLIALDTSIDGAALRSNTFAEAVADSFLSDQSPVEIPVVVTKPDIDSNNLGALGIDGLLSRATSNYANGSSDRDLNIEVGTALMNGELIPPGGQFSFNGAVGEITYDKGFVDAGVIEAETIGRAVGGGICQVSTTVFRAALLAGMPMSEWWPHSLRLQGYERDGWTAGFDASILQSGSNPELWGDFRFKNDTDGYMLVHSWNEYPHNIVEIYGNDDGRSVELSTPQFSKPKQTYEDREVVDYEAPAGSIEQTQWPTAPYAAWYTRTITYADGTVVDRVFESIYEGSGNVYRVSPDMKGKSPAGRG